MAPDTNQATPSDDTIAAEAIKPTRASANDAAVPDAIADRFLRVDNRYYFPDRTLAFTDHGAKLQAQTHNIEVIRSLVTIAQARGWEAIKVSGSEEFCRLVWREASLRGIDV